ncbi:uncharacterized protein EI97DRAFT_408425 [Westerdykella ornata]|uniref:RING-CH-type domain-containing protein n=1 Tax=Westerdykella ornata TaxID=318751 RepID=A0A6A6J501_WESOR|nr:uncharacterized protein EI97DRAFT_408425 [Westerdykella ornata]KAF2271314.1 hypothetical protein EI97DRAFT_408425 [Westerdykella ornata]
MASLPARPESQRRQVGPASSELHEPAIPASNTSGTAPDPSSAVVLNDPAPSSRTEPPAEDPSYRQSDTPHTTTALPPPASENNEPRRCWICFMDETEDDETSSDWRSPCPCALEAHESCLLDWIADMEQTGSTPRKIQCPQCKSEIRLRRPRSLVVDAVRVLEHFVAVVRVPCFITVAGTAAFSTLSLIGKAHIYEIFGAEDALRILAPLYQAPRGIETTVAAAILRDFQQHWRLHLGLPLIPTILMASRTSAADSILPFIPLIFFVSSGRPQDELLHFSWPPSAAFTVAALPYIRNLYNTYYERVWAPKEHKWLKQIQPRAASGEDLNAREIGALRQNDDMQEDEIVEDALEIEVDIDFDIFRDWNNGGAADNHAAAENPPVPIARGPGAPPDVAPGVGQQGNPGDGVHVRRRVDNVTVSMTNIANSILGALIFPSIAAVVGEVLRMTLPKAWVTPPLSGKPTGFLQARWGRSILGGCLFVGIKDVIMLYVRWRMAQNHMKRVILDHDKSKSKGRVKRQSTR